MSPVSYLEWRCPTPFERGQGCLYLWDTVIITCNYRSTHGLRFSCALCSRVVLAFVVGHWNYANCVLKCHLLFYMQNSFAFYLLGRDFVVELGVEFGEYFGNGTLSSPNNVLSEWGGNANNC
ncbi:hypothetical protein CEXT_13011 [Caerostris extrusa]|uniref:Uncharacterized protein n=1 Tax=Caerostris extrusa TaxID=172846 RepID=A0AAV4VAI7_CAEEX|nr:hypothetical protein CEXT_13011 [Caerostris extrusa]